MERVGHICVIMCGLVVLRVCDAEEEPDGDEEEFANALSRFVNDEQLRTRLAKNGYMTISEQFSIERYASKIEDIYLSILGK